MGGAAVVQEGGSEFESGCRYSTHEYDVLILIRNQAKSSDLQEGTDRKGSSQQQLFSVRLARHTLPLITSSVLVLHSLIAQHSSDHTHTTPTQSLHALTHSQHNSDTNTHDHTHDHTYLCV